MKVLNVCYICIVFRGVILTEVWITFSGLTPPYPCTCPKSGSGLSMAYVAFYGWLWEVVGWFVDKLLSYGAFIIV